MNRQADQRANRGKASKAQSWRGYRAAVVVSLTLATLLGFWVWVVLCTLVTWTPLAFFMKWHYALLVALLSGAVVTISSWWSIRQRRLWFTCIPGMVAWGLLALLLLQSFIATDDYQRFILHCATVERGETVDAFAKRMASWGWPPPTYDLDRPPEGLGAAEFHQAGAESFTAYFDKATGEILRWRFLHD